MADEGQRTEKPTKRRLDKAREEGRFPVSKELVSAVQFACFVWLLAASSLLGIQHIGAFTRTILAEAFRVELNVQTVTRLYRQSLFSVLIPILTTSAGLAAVLLVAQLSTTQLSISLQKLSPDLSRLNPLQKIKDLPKQGMTGLLHAAVLLPIFGFAAYRIAADNIDRYLALPSMPIIVAIRIVGESYESLLWKATSILVLIGVIDYIRQTNRHSKSLRMTKQEVKQESKESEGNPETKMRIRRIQRDLARRNMMKEVPKATAVIVNPTHYSVAIRYDMESMAAPRVVAKGKNYLAHRIRQIALENQVPIIENQPLAQALYKSADVGQEIPPQLYKAVAEILAYLFKLMHQGRR